MSLNPSETPPWSQNMIFHCTTTCSDCSSPQFLGYMPKNISYLGFPQNVQFFSNFMQLEYGFFSLYWKFMDISQENLSQKCPRGRPPFPSSSPIPPSRIALSLWRLQMVSAHFTWVTPALGNFLNALVILSFFHPQSGIEEQSFLKFRSNQFGHSSFTTEADVFFYFNCIPTWDAVTKK